MAKPREARGWFLYAVGVSVAFLMLAFRLYYETVSVAPPFLIFTFLDLPVLIGGVAVAFATVGLHQGLWYFLVKPDGRIMYAASLLMFAVALLLFYTAPGHLVSRDVFLLQFTAGLVLFLYVPALSYRSRTFLGIGVAGGGLLLASSFLGPSYGSAPLTTPLVLVTIAAEGVLVFALLRLLQMSIQGSRTSVA